MAVTKTILLVDDDNELREALAEQFDLYEGFTVLQAENATQGVKLAEAERTDLILLDVDMPDMDGREACKLMRTRGVRAPIIMLITTRYQRRIMLTLAMALVLIGNGGAAIGSDFTAIFIFRSVSSVSNSLIPG